VEALFPDANVLFSAAWRSDSGLRRLWSLSGVELVTSGYAAEEARRNLEESERLQRLERLLDGVRIVAEVDSPLLPDDIDLPGKDRPILQAAIAAGCTHLLTGDQTHFGPLFGASVSGVEILRPASFLRQRGT
jgi:predicted nucleic acid-binding protein